MRSPIQSNFLALVLAALLLLAGLTALATALRGAPAFDPAARQPGVFGDWRVPVTAAFYNRADYLFHLGYGYVQADLFASGATEARDEVAAFEVAVARAETAAALLAESVALAPANGHAWAYLAWAQALGGDLERAAETMLQSWHLAPHSLQLAPTRLSFYELLGELAEAGITAPPGPALRAGAARDVVVLDAWNRPYLAALVLGSPVLAALARESGVTAAPDG